MTNYHTHYSICDGRGEAGDFAEAAAARGFTALGFSSHAPLPYPNSWTMKAEDLPRYLGEIRRLRELWRDRLEIYLGLEVDHLPGPGGRSVLSWNGEGLDYTIGAVHAFRSAAGRYREVDGPEEMFLDILNVDFGGDPRPFVEEYYRRVADLAVRHRPAILAHFDLIKKNNPDGRHFRESEPWYRRAVEEAVSAVASSGVVVEVNTGGLARGRASLYPSPWILRLFRTAGAPVMLNSDAHAPEQLDAFFPEAREAVRDAGYRELRVLRRGGWESVPL